MRREVGAALILILSMALVLAAGGGGGEGEGGGGESSSSSGGGVKIPENEFINLQCFDDGHVEMTIRNTTAITARFESSNENITLKGKYENNKFTSDEVQLNSQGTYILNAGKKSARVTCPGLLFACKLLDIQTLSCIKSGSSISAQFMLINDTNLENIKINFRSQSNMYSYVSNQRSSALKDLQLRHEGNLVLAHLPNGTDIEEIEVIHQKCIGKRYLYARTKCDLMQNASLIQAPKVDPQTLKCGGLLDISDRVRCRINLESEQAEYNNFFPEECRNHKDPDNCLEIYREVSECWDLEPYAVRRDCLASRINLTTTTTICTDFACRKAESEKRLTMIKLRFYNLEEQAEILEERGKLDREKLILFVVEIEKKKKQINAAKNKEEIAQVILEARALWTELMKEVKP